MRTFSDSIADSKLPIIFGRLISAGGVDADMDQLDFFRGEFPKNIFPDEYCPLYAFIMSKHISGGDVSWELLLDADRASFLNSENIIKDRCLGGVNVTEESFWVQFKLLVLDIVGKCRDLNVSQQDFLDAVKVYKAWYLDRFYVDLLEVCTRIDLSGGWVYRRGRRCFLQGYTGAKSYYADQLLLLESLRNNKGSGTVSIDESWLTNGFLEMRKGYNTIVDFGLTQVDKSMKFCKGHLLGIAGPPKGGKTRTAVYMVARCLLRGLNVCVWPLEGSVNEWLSMVGASIIAQEKEILTASGVHVPYISSMDFLGGTKSADADVQITGVLTALATHSGFGSCRQLGRLEFIEQSAEAGSFLDVLDTKFEGRSSELVPDVLVIDPLINILGDGSVSKSERISDCYIRFKDYVQHKRNVLGIVPCQLKQESIKALKGHADATLDETSGGESSETIRTPDYVIGIYASDEERAESRQRIYCVANRHGASFQMFYAHMDFGCCCYSPDDAARMVNLPSAVAAVGQ